MTFKPTYDQRNRENLDKLAPNTKVLAYGLYQYCLDNEVDILIYETIRTVERQKELLADGKSKTMRSYHIVGQALDFVAVKDGKTDFSLKAYQSAPIKKMVEYAKKIGFEWGGDWTSFKDCPHLQFNYKGYGTDIRLDTSAPMRDGKMYRVQTGTWDKDNPEQIAHLEKMEQIFRQHYAKVVYRQDEGGRYRILTGTYGNYETARDVAKEVQTKYGVLCYPVEAS